MIKTIANKVSYYNRNRKYNNFIATFCPKENDKILDVGANDIEYSVVDNYLEKVYPYPSNITVLGLHKYEEFKKKYSEIKTVTYDGRVFPFADNSFDICWCNAVLEHVGSFQDQVFFIKEIKRTCKQAIVTTPNRFFPIEVHTKIPFLHFLPKSIFDKILKQIGKGWAAGEYMNLLSYRQLIHLLNEAGAINYSLYKNKLIFFTIDFSIYINDN